MMSLQDAKRTAQKNESRLCERVILKTNKEGVVLSDGNNEDIAERNYRYTARYVAIKLKKETLHVHIINLFIAAITKSAYYSSPYVTRIATAYRWTLCAFPIHLHVIYAPIDQLSLFVR